MPKIAHPVYYPRISMTVIYLSVSISVPLIGFAGGTVILDFRCGSRPLHVDRTPTLSSIVGLYSSQFGT
jgi:hypothetical protein